MPVTYPQDYSDLQSLVNVIFPDSPVQDTVSSEYNWINGSEWFRVNPQTKDEREYYLYVLNNFYPQVVDKIGWTREAVEAKFNELSAILSRCDNFNWEFALAWTEWARDNGQIQASNGALTRNPTTEEFNRYRDARFNYINGVNINYNGGDSLQKPIGVMKRDNRAYRNAINVYREILIEYLNSGNITVENWGNYVHRVQDAYNVARNHAVTFETVGRWGIWTNAMPYDVSPRTIRRLGYPPPILGTIFTTLTGESPSRIEELI